MTMGVAVKMVGRVSVGMGSPVEVGADVST